MTGTTHALAGATLGRLCRRPGWAVALGIASHALLDVLPHRDPPGRLSLLLDGAGVAAVTGSLLVRREWGMLAGAVGALLPDLEHLGHLGNPHARGWFPSHRRSHGARSARQGVAVEGVVAQAALLVLALCAARGRRSRGPAPTGGGS
jgi:hypothetical protein